MRTTTQLREIWFTTTPKGSKRAWTFSYAAFRAVPVRIAEAELDIMTGAAVVTAKPGWVGK